MTRIKRKVSVNSTVDEDEYEYYKRVTLRGTRFDNNGEVNASAAYRHYIESENEKTRRSALVQPSQDRSAIKQLSTNDNTKQATFNKLSVEWILDYKNRERRDKVLESFTVEERRTLAIACRNTGNAIVSTLPKLVVSHNDKDKLRKRLDLGNIKTVTILSPEQEKEELDLEEEEIILK